MPFIGNKPSAVPLTSADITDGIITSAKIADGAIVNADINASAGIVSSKLSGTGKVLQVISVSELSTFSTSSSSYVDVTSMSIAITPSSASSKIFITFFAQGSTSATDTGHIRLNKGGSDLFIGATSSSRQRATVGITSGDQPVSGLTNLSFSYLDSPNTTSATTYKITMRANTGTAYLGRSQVDGDSAGYPRTPTSFTVMEIAG
jgi:hypothetical protein